MTSVVACGYNPGTACWRLENPGRSLVSQSSQPDSEKDSDSKNMKESGQRGYPILSVCGCVCVCTEIQINSINEYSPESKNTVT